jgi:hypothetical protein
MRNPMEKDRLEHVGKVKGIIQTDNEHDDYHLLGDDAVWLL